MKPIHIGLVADPASPTEIARRIRHLHPPPGVDGTWDIEVVNEPFTIGSEDVDAAVARLGDQVRQHEWDLVVGLTEMPLRAVETAAARPLPRRTTRRSRPFIRNTDAFQVVRVTDYWNWNGGCGSNWFIRVNWRLGISQARGQLVRIRWARVNNDGSRGSDVDRMQVGEVDGALGGLLGFDNPPVFTPGSRATSPFSMRGSFRMT